MGSQTAKGYPYPVGTDRVMDGDDAIKALADAADLKAGILSSGKLVVPINGVQGSVAVTFPVGRFTVAPSVTANTDNSLCFACVVSPTTSGFTFYAVSRSGGSITVNPNCYWIARQE